jgi:hypothetical protein
MYDLKKIEERELRIYHFIAKLPFTQSSGADGQIKYGLLDKLINVIEYDLEKAIVIANNNQEIPKGTSVSVAGNTPVSVILSQVKSSAELIPAPESVEKKMSKESFIASLKLAANEYLTDEADKTVLADLISKIEV